MVGRQRQSVLRCHAAVDGRRVELGVDLRRHNQRRRTIDRDDLGVIVDSGETDLDATVHGGRVHRP